MKPPLNDSFSLPASSALERFHVVLVEPGVSRNVGSVARAMMNLGFYNLHLVAPPRYSADDAAMTAVSALPLLESAKFHSTLAEALAPMQHVAGFTARHGKNRPEHKFLAQWCVEVFSDFPGETALVFGPEDSGLRNEHLPFCHELVRIPSRIENPSFNLSQAVMLALFELGRSQWEGAVTGEKDTATERDFQQLEQLVEESLTRSHFFDKGTPESIPGMVKHLLRRTTPDKREMQILLGMFGKINRTLAGRIPPADYSRPTPFDDSGRKKTEKPIL